MGDPLTGPQTPVKYFLVYYSRSTLTFMQRETVHPTDIKGKFGTQ